MIKMKKKNEMFMLMKKMSTSAFAEQIRRFLIRSYSFMDQPCLVIH